MVQVSVQTGRETGLVWRFCCYRGSVFRVCWPGRLPGPGHLQRGPRQRRVRRPVRPEARGDGAGPGVGAAVQWEVRSGGQTAEAWGGVEVESLEIKLNYQEFYSAQVLQWRGQRGQWRQCRASREPRQEGGLRAAAWGTLLPVDQWRVWKIYHKYFSFENYPNAQPGLILYSNTNYWNILRNASFYLSSNVHRINYKVKMYVMTLNILYESIKSKIHWESLSQPHSKLINLAVKLYIFRSIILKI